MADLRTALMAASVAAEKKGDPPKHGKKKKGTKVPPSFLSGARKGKKTAKKGNPFAKAGG
jgi:hypothetical protein